MSPSAGFREILAVGTVLTTVFLGVGCAGSPAQPNTVPVTGTVLYQGAPVEGATVSFWAEKAPRAATGVTNARGEFSLSMFSANDGALPGENQITVSKAAAAPAQSTTPDLDLLDDPAALAKSSGGAVEGGPEAPKALLPAKFGDLKTTTLKETVTASGPNKFVLQLTDPN